jgi:hypothetical protein
LHAKPRQNYAKLFHDPLNDGIYISPDLEKTAIPKKPGKNFRPVILPDVGTRH